LSKSTQHSDIKLSGTNSKFGIIKVIKKICFFPQYFYSS